MEPQPPAEIPDPPTPQPASGTRHPIRPVSGLLLLPFLGLLWVPFYNAETPALFGFPFFYWYQLAWVPVTSLLIWIVYRGDAHD